MISSMGVSSRVKTIIIESVMLSAFLPCAAQTWSDGCAQADIILLDEDFSGSTVGSMDNISYTGDIDGITASSGWTASAIGTSAGNFVFAPSLTPVTLSTPSVRVNTAAPLVVSLTMAEYNNERYYVGATVDVSLLEADGSLTSRHAVTLSEAGYGVYDIRFDAPLSASDVRVLISYGNDRSNRKLFLDRLTLRQVAEASVDDVACSHGRAWVSAPGEITVSGGHVRLYSVDGRCLYDGHAATLHVDDAVVIAIVDGAPVKLKP